MAAFALLRVCDVVMLVMLVCAGQGLARGILRQNALHLWLTKRKFIMKLRGNVL